MLRKNLFYYACNFLNSLHIQSFWWQHLNTQTYCMKLFNFYFTLGFSFRCDQEICFQHGPQSNHVFRIARHTLNQVWNYLSSYYRLHVIINCL